MGNQTAVNIIFICFLPFFINLLFIALNGKNLNILQFTTQYFEKLKTEERKRWKRRNNRLLNAKLNKYIVPGIMISLALQLGNIVDTIFVSNLIGVEAMSAVTLSLPVETIVQH